MNNKPGDRVELINCSDPYATLEPGTTGTVNFVDDLGTVFVTWDNGAGLGLVPGEDRWFTLSSTEGNTLNIFTSATL